jgi:galactokinase
MFAIVKRERDELPDVQRFVEMINDDKYASVGFFSGDSDVIIARAPGRLDVMGGIADYSGSLVLQMPIAESTIAAVQLNDSDLISIESADRGSGEILTFEFTTTSLGSESDELARLCRGQWYGYAAGVFIILQREVGSHFDSGASIVISSDIPIGKGVSSSAALEVSVMTAVCEAYGIDLDARTIAMLCQKVENSIVGAACGIMDQMSVNFGIEDSLLSMVCQPAELDDPLPIPSNIYLAGIDSGVRHAVVGSDYASVRTAAFMGYRIIASLAGFPSSVDGDGLVEINDPRWHNYLSNVTVAEYESQFDVSIPERLTGGEFLEKFGGITDRVTSVDLNQTYRVKASTEHAIYENRRIHRFREIFRGPIGLAELEELGQLMFATHESYSRCGLTEEGTDLLVALARQYKDRGVYGARITGGGSGGTVAFLADRDSAAAVRSLAEEYKTAAGRETYFFEGSSPGCASYGIVRLRFGQADMVLA